MKVTLVNTYDIQGGAARAAYRLHRGLLQLNQESTLVSRYVKSEDPSITQVGTEERGTDKSAQTVCFEAIQDEYIDKNRSTLTNTYFSLPYPGYDLTDLQPIHDAEVINLHWVARFQSSATIHRLLRLGKPVVWTLHDMWAFTGGCHYSAGCLKYQSDCDRCLQLQHDPYHLTATILNDKLKFLQEPNLTIVTPSQWLAECAKQSSVFRNHRVDVIPYSLDTDVFVPTPKQDAKNALGIASDCFTIMFGAISISEERKGFFELLQAIWRCRADAKFQKLVDDQKIALLCVGYPNEWVQSLGIPVHTLGYVESDEKMSMIYSAADVFVLPSLEDNLPNTMLEALSCGTPVVAFDVGGFLILSSRVKPVG